MERGGSGKRDYRDIGCVKRDPKRETFGPRPAPDISYLVAREKIGDVVVSTIYLARDVSKGSGQPRKFQTLVLGGKFHMFKTYSATLDEARDRHANVAEKIALIEEFKVGSDLPAQFLDYRKSKS